MLRKTKNKLLKNRHGQELMIDFWAILVFAIIVVGFLVVLSIDKNKTTNKMNTEFENKDVQFMLDTFLRAPLTDNPSKTVSDMIAEDAAIGDFSRTKNLFRAYFKLMKVTNNNEIVDIALKIDGEGDAQSSNYRFMKMTAKRGQDFGEVYYTHESLGSTVNKYAESYIPGYNGRIRVTLRVSEEVYIAETVEDVMAGKDSGTTTAPKTKTQTDSYSQYRNSDYMK